MWRGGFPPAVKIARSCTEEVHVLPSTPFLVLPQQRSKVHGSVSNMSKRAQVKHFNSMLSRYLTESPAAARGLLDHDAGTDNVSELGEEAEQGLVGHGVGDVEHEQVAPVRACSPEHIHRYQCK